MRDLKYAIVITGGISTGKSTACNLLRLYGYSVIDADKISHQSLDLARDKVVKKFGDGILSDGKIDRKKLAPIVFSDKNKMKILEDILHPMIRERIFMEALDLESYKKIYFIDIPLFFEANLKDKNTYPIEKILLIYAPKDLQLERLIKRDNLSKTEALKRIESQIDIETKKSLSTYVVENTSNLANLQSQIESFLRNIEV